MRVQSKTVFLESMIICSDMLVQPHNGILLSNNKNELLIHVATWTNVKVTMLSENNRPIDQTRKNPITKNQLYTV